MTPNNFDLLRLIAAAQVMLAHTDYYVLHKTSIVQYLPGVPVFFFISGFLISASWENSSGLHSYFQKRALRIFPALWGVWVFTIITLLAFYDRGVLLQNGVRLAAWSIMQATIFQDWNPAFLNGFGTGVMNGALWTIPVEIGFYVLVPLAYFVMSKVRRPNLFLGVVAGLSWLLLVAMVLPSLNGSGARWMEWILLSPLPWFGMFLAGAIAQRYRDQILPLLKGRFLQMLALYCALAALSTGVTLFPLLRANGNAMGVLNFLALCPLILSAAYSAPQLADRLLRRNDISYGIYLSHMPVLNLVTALGVSGYAAFAMVIAGSTLLAWLSWNFIEKPALALRAHPLLSRSQDSAPRVRF